MKKRLYHFFAIAIPAVFASLQLLNAQGDVTENFLYKHHSTPASIPYRLFIPDEYDTLKTYPLVLTLHGLGECGTDNYRHIQLNHLATCWADQAFQAKHPHFIVSPQCPVGYNWTTNAVKATVAEIIDSLINNYSIDRDRIYVTGLSLGGNGTWDYMISNPDLYAAGIPVCGWHDSSRVKTISHIPVWNHHGSSDGSVPVSSSRMLMSAYEKHNKPVVYTHCGNFTCKPLSAESKYELIADDVDYVYSEYKNWGHDVWNIAYTDTTILEWLFSKHRRTRDMISFSGIKGYETLNQEHTFQFESPVDSGNITLLLSADLGFTWQLAGESSGAIDSIRFNTSQFADSPVSLFKIQLRNEEGNIYGTHYSGYLNLNNTGNGIPVLRYRPVKIISTITADSIAIGFLTADAEGDPLSLRVYYKNDDTSQYSEAEHFTMEPLPIYQERFITMKTLAYGKKARLKFTLSDDEYTVSDSTDYFLNKHNQPSVISDPETEPELLLFPNPAKDFINLQYNSALLSFTSLTLTLIDLTGRIISSETLLPVSAGMLRFKLPPNLNKGLYMVLLNTGDKRIIRRLIID
jgi:predicted esterase